ncbi:acetyltransferase [Corynebacterium sp. 13CS0277]|nr:acetyltransferase [Corynebacterium sp. 13CS0277]
MLSVDKPLSEADAQATKYSRIRRVPALDGLRGIAVSAVVLYHFFAPLLPGGYLGVDMFFVLSGFLITSLLIRERAATGRIDLKKFWVRRARRILPAAVSVLVIMTVVTGIVGGDPAVGLPTQFFGTLFFVNNWTQIAGSQSYFADSGVQVFAHYWSLAVEEQFYVFFPLLFVLLTRKKIGWSLPAACLAGAAASAAWMAFLYDPATDPTRVYYGTDTHAFGLLIGAATALLLTTPVAKAADSWPLKRNPCADQMLRNLGGIITLVGLGVLMYVLPDTAPATYRGGLVGASLCTAVLVACVVAGRSWLAQIVSIVPLRWLGERSFSLYLWHWPIVVLLRHLLPGWQYWEIGLIAMLISLPVSAWSYLAIEEPIRRGGYKGTMVKFLDHVTADGSTAGRAFARLCVVGLLVLGAIVALATAPTQSALEKDLAEYKKLAQQQTPPPAPTSEAPKGPQRTMPAGSNIIAIGDSVMLASSPALMEKFPGIYVDGEVSRALVSIPPVLEDYAAQGALRDVVFLGFGTNSNIQGETMDTVMEILGPDRTVIITNPYGDRWWIPESRAAIAAALDRYDNLYVADWCGSAMSNHALLRPDMIHPTEDGAVVYAEDFAAALQQWVDDDRLTPQECGL